MDQRLRHVVARKPGEVVLVAELVLDFVQLRLAADSLYGAAEEVLLDGHDLADGPVVDPLDGFPDIRDRSGCASPDITLSFFCLANSQAAVTCRTPTGSMACGFSTKTCLPASMAARRYTGWYFAEQAISTTSTLSITCL